MIDTRLPYYIPVLCSRTRIFVWSLAVKRSWKRGLPTICLLQRIIILSTSSLRFLFRVISNSRVYGVRISWKRVISSVISVINFLLGSNGFGDKRIETVQINFKSYKFDYLKERSVMCNFSITRYYYNYTRNYCAKGSTDEKLVFSKILKITNYKVWLFHKGTTDSVVCNLQLARYYCSCTRNCCTRGSTDEKFVLSTISYVYRVISRLRGFPCLPWSFYTHPRIDCT